MKICRNNLIQCAKICLILLCVAICLSAQKISLGKNELQSFERSIDEGRIDEVEKNLFNYVVANPKDAVGFSLLAKLRLKQDRPNEARSLSQKALMLDPNLLSAKLNLALVSIQLGEIEQAQLLLNGISENEITSNTIRLNLSQTFALAGDCAKALITVDKLPLRIKNRDALPLRGVCYLETGDKKSFDSLIPIAKALAKLDPAVAVKFAELLNKAGKPKEASDLLRSIVTTAPKNILALLLLARSEIYLKDFANAKHHLDRAEKLRPDSAEMLFVKSLLEREMGNAVQSLDLLEKALAASPNDVEILAQFVLTTMRTNQAGRAVRAAENLLNRQPDNLEFLYLYGAASLQNNNLEAAETSLRKFTESRPQDARGCLALGLTFAAQPDKLQEARQQMQRCLEINPNNYEASYQLGLSYKTQGETAMAVKYLEETVRLAPNNALALRDLGAVYLQSGAEVKARLLLEKAVALNPKDAETHFQLSRLYNLTGQRELAKTHLEIFQKMKNTGKNGI